MQLLKNAKFRHNNRLHRTHGAVGFGDAHSGSMIWINCLRFTPSHAPRDGEADRYAA
jgi:hypothetical protein